MPSFIAGCSFWITNEQPPHLWFIISDPVVDERQVVYVNFTSFHSDRPTTLALNDPACVVQPGEHSFVTKPTCVFYHGAQVASIAHLERKAARGELKLDDPANGDLLEKMRQSALDSDHVMPDCLKILSDQGLI